MLHFGMNMPFYLMMIYGSMMIIVVLILRGLFRNRMPKFVFPVLWGIVLLRFVIPFSVSSPLSIPMPWNYLTPYETAYASSMIMEDVSFLQTGTGIAGRGQASSDVGEIREDMIGYVSSTAEGTSVYTDIDIPFFTYFTWHRILFVVYIIGLMTTAGILGWQKRNYMEKLRKGLLIEHNETINEILRSMEMGHVLVFSNDEIASPMVCGLLNPRIYLPTQMDFQNTQLLRYVLTHETMHIRRKDNWMKCMMILVLCLNWFNPLVWMMSKYFASDLEAACDAAVLHFCGEDAKKEYAFSLLAMAITGNRTSLLYSAFSKTEVEKRVNNILHYKKMTVFVLLFTVLFMTASMAVFASVGQAPFWDSLTSYCASSNSRWGVKVTITRDIALGTNAKERAEDKVFSVLRTDETSDPGVIKSRIKEALAKEFGVEKGAFDVEVSLCISDEELRKEYAEWGLSAGTGDTLWNYRGETIRIYEDKMLGRYQSNVEGVVDISVQRNDFGEITSVSVWHEGDLEYDERTRRMEIERYQQSGYGADSAVTVTDMVIEEY